MDVETLQKYYQSLWRAYIFVSPEIFRSKARCDAIIRGFCSEYNVEWNAAIEKSRGHDFGRKEGTELQPDLPLTASGKKFDAETILIRAKSLKTLTRAEANDLRRFLVGFTDRANARSTREQDRIAKELDDLLSPQQLGLNRPSDVKTAFERILEPDLNGEKAG
jgi:hypothetical protein